MENSNFNPTNSAQINTAQNTGTVTFFNTWSNPERVKVNEYQDSIEMIYKQESTISNNWGKFPPRIFKIVFSCIDGKWNKSEPIYGKIIPEQKEYYEFED